ncbi:hypothetical protein NL676_039342 [Syzygium grande]|nr:hypothetical protein NL676_039342 [Syzygium grande]
MGLVDLASVTEALIQKEERDFVSREKLNSAPSHHSLKIIHGFWSSLSPSPSLERRQKCDAGDGTAETGQSSPLHQRRSRFFTHHFSQFSCLIAGEFLLIFVNLPRSSSSSTRAMLLVIEAGKE